MKRVLDNYVEGIMSMFMGYGISYYAYISIVLSEIFYMWRFLPENAMPFTILLIVNCVVIGVFGALKRICAFTKGERIFAKLYCVALAAMFVIGCFINLVQNLVLYFLPLVFAIVWIFLRDIQTMRFATSDSKILLIITAVFSNVLMMLFLLIFVSFTPLIIVAYVVNLVFETKLLTFCIPVALAMILPFIAWFEEYFVNENIFEIGYEIVFTKGIEDLLKELNISAEVFWSEEFQEAVLKLEESDESEEAWKEFTEELKRIQNALNETKKRS